MTPDEMTDEAYGRAWAAQNEQGAPHKVATGKYLWYGPDDNGYPHMHGSLVVLLDHEFYPDESAAYAGLGRAVREVRREVPPVRIEAT